MTSPITPERQAKRDLYPSVGFRGRQPVDASTAVLEPFSVAVAVANTANPAAASHPRPVALRTPHRGSDGRWGRKRANSSRRCSDPTTARQGLSRGILNSCRHLAGSSCYPRVKCFQQPKRGLSKCFEPLSLPALHAEQSSMEKAVCGAEKLSIRSVK